MIRLALAIALALLACDKAPPPMQPLQIPTWTTFPDDDAIVSAILGTGGSSDARRLADRAVRDTLLPQLVENRDLVDLRSQITDLELRYASESGSEPAARLVRVGVKTELQRLVHRSMALSQVRLRDTLWPGEPIPEAWSAGAKLPRFANVAELVAAATAVERRLDELTGRYGLLGPSEERSAALIRNSVAVARTGSHEITYGPVYKELTARGVSTRPLPEATPH